MDQNLAASGGPSPDRTAMQAAPRALKVAVIVMGIMLVVGFTVVFITIGYRAANPRTPEPVAAGFETRLSIPVGSEVAGLDVQDGRALVTVRSGDDHYMVIVLDTAKGAEIGRFVLAPE